MYPKRKYGSTYGPLARRKRRKRTIYSHTFAPKPRLSNNISRYGEVHYKDIILTAASVTTGSAQTAHLSNISVSDVHDGRTGSEIHILGVDITGSFGTTNGPLLDGHLCLMYEASPVVTNFTAGIGGALDKDKGIDFLHTVGGNKSSGIVISRHYRFKTPLKVVYDGTTGSDVIRNQLHYAVINNCGSTASGLSMTFRVYFQDS